MIEINYTLFLQMANFLVLLLLLDIVLFKPIRSIIQERKVKVKSLESDSKEFDLNFEEAYKDLKAVQRDAQNEGISRRNSLKNEAFEQEKALLAEVNQEMETESAKVLSQIKDQVNNARKKLLEQAEGFSVILAEKILGRSLS